MNVTAGNGVPNSVPANEVAELTTRVSRSENGSFPTSCVIDTLMMISATATTASGSHTLAYCSPTFGDQNGSTATEPERADAAVWQG